jgi:uncharacterized protein
MRFGIMCENFFYLNVDMLIVLSPAKTLNLEPTPAAVKHTVPDFIEDSTELIETLRTYSPAQLASLMHISDPLASLNFGRFNAWSPIFTARNAKPAILTFDGDVYTGLNAGAFNTAQLGYTQSHIRILSGLHGVLRPLDLMQPYRLEMGTRLPNARGKNLYAFWGAAITVALARAMNEHKHAVLVNLASEEYFKAVNPSLLGAPVITPVFEDWKNGKYRVISFYAKRARGLMARFAAANNIRQAEKLKAFATDGYAFDTSVSTETSWVFRRRSNH